ncbi:hypothetical protein Pmar_PMAR006266 [Perkinsus marinus ATCC 50983]|uniref:Uncharacterized protein n=1 Tax=Perkinsus marinus (strain ATCC 50983 / TXsc) TaxID=423536 RepID=C5LAJ9_PERM5|nr:hypothetical protein Pmar_PMAR006266 [Perkinsus marinus ATCC 50983]EER06455.1 hypothetical protein Pmar_PMAR006266 [Perkinsus marinus ATCC 50983]|eukprot:XP_002774639.1 hypothetical protein Pmar_PMAR006266 [Perkinsus marinus ATCC 50983]
MAKLRRKYQSLEKAYKALEEENDTVKEQLKQREESLEVANSQVKEKERQLESASEMSGLVTLAQVLCAGCLIPVLGALLLLLMAQPLLPPPLKVELNASSAVLPEGAPHSSQPAAWRQMFGVGSSSSSRYFPTLPPGPMQYIWTPWRPEEVPHADRKTSGLCSRPDAGEHEEEEGTCH